MECQPKHFRDCYFAHTTQALKPCYQNFIKPLKLFFHNKAKVKMNHHINRNLTRYQAGYLIGNDWEKAASIGNGVSSLRATGIEEGKKTNFNLKTTTKQYG